MKINSRFEPPLRFAAQLPLTSRKSSAGVPPAPTLRNLQPPNSPAIITRRPCPRLLICPTVSSFVTLLTLFAIPSLAQQAQDQNSGDPNPNSLIVVAQTPYAVTARDGNQKIWTRTTWESNSVTGELTAITNSYTELATGSGFLSNGIWTDSNDQIQITATGAQATNSQHKLVFLGNINSQGAIEIILPEGDKQLASTPIGLSFKHRLTDYQ